MFARCTTLLSLAALCFMAAGCGGLRGYISGGEHPSAAQQRGSAWRFSTVQLTGSDPSPSVAIEEAAR